MFLYKKKNEGNIFEIEKSDQYHTIDDLIKKSQPNSVYYTFLILSAVIISSGLLLENTAILIGGMLVTPVLTPVLLFSLGLSTFEYTAVRKAGLLIAVSFFLIGIISSVTAYLFGTNEISFFLVSSVSEIFYLYFLVAFSSGVAATLAWSRKEMADVLPGVAMAISLVPPISLVGIALGTGQPHLTNTYLYVLVFNLIGIILGSFLVFVLLKFYKTRGEIEKEIESEKN